MVAIILAVTSLLMLVLMYAVYDKALKLESGRKSIQPLYVWDKLENSVEVWCEFPTWAKAIEAERSLNDFYGGTKQFALYEDALKKVAMYYSQKHVAPAAPRRRKIEDWPLVP